jgi:ABC-2 type transport system ATP-binding protein
MIELQNINKLYKGVSVLNNLSYTFNKGKIYQITGSNGSGKSTLLKIILGLCDVNAGSIYINNKMIRIFEDRPIAIGFFLDSDQLIEFLTPKEYFCLVCNGYRSNSEISLFNDIYNEPKLIRNLSKGSQLKVGIISAVMVAKDLLVLDEPFSHLDVNSKLELSETIQYLNEKLNLTIILTSHDSIEVQSSNLIKLALIDGILE